MRTMKFIDLFFYAKGGDSLVLIEVQGLENHKNLFIAMKIIEPSLKVLGSLDILDKYSVFYGEKFRFYLNSKKKIIKSSSSFLFCRNDNFF